MAEPGSDKIEIPPQELGRQATRSLGGYIYQVYQSLSAWLSLRDNEILLLEVTEDFGTLFKGLVTQTQVKEVKSGATITLRSKAVAKLIDSHWALAQQNPEKTIVSVLMTTATIGNEAGPAFPDKKPGLEYWRTAARIGTDVEPLRAALVGLAISPGAREFIANCSPDELKQQLLAPVKWVTSAPRFDELRKRILDGLVNLGDRHGCPSTDSERAEHALIGEIILTVIRSSTRELTRADLLRVFDAAVSVSIPISVLRKMLGDLTGSPLASGREGTIRGAHYTVRRADTVPLPPRIAPRTELIHQIQATVGSFGAMWLHGSSGLGKTTLALLVGRGSSGNWLFIDLRSADSSEITSRLSVAMKEMEVSRYDGVVVDDYSVENGVASIPYLHSFAEQARFSDSLVVITSSRSPSPNTRSRFGDDRLAVMEVPYLTQSDVGVLIGEAGGEASIWQAVIHAFCGNGHPQLVDARILGLKQRGWNQEELLSELKSPQGVAKEVGEEKQAIVGRLLQELSPEQRELLFRLSLSVTGFDRALALAIADVEPSVSRPGEILQHLLGPWIETRGNDRFSLSPLVSGSGATNLGAKQQSAIRKAFIENLLPRNPFPAEYLMPLITFGFSERHLGCLNWFMYAMMGLFVRKRLLFKQLAEGAISFFAYFKWQANESPFAEYPGLSLMLRMVQLQVCIENNQSDIALATVHAIEAETKVLQDSEVNPYLRHISLSSVLSRQELKLSPLSWFPLLMDFRAVLRAGAGLADFPTELKALDGMPAWNADQLLFAVRATALVSVDELSELFAELDRLPGEDRQYLISGLREPIAGLRIVISGPWLNQSKRQELDGLLEAEKYARLADVGRRWGSADIEIECECARAVMLDEYADLGSDALALLDRMATEYPRDYRILRRKQNVLFRMRRHADALAVIRAAMDEFPADDYIERAFAWRDAARSAAIEGDLREARGLFLEACSSAKAFGAGMNPMVPGLLGDCAVCSFDLGEVREAIQFAKEALENTDQIDPNGTASDRYCLIVLGHLIVWLRKRLKNQGWENFESAMFAGACSNPAPPPEFETRPVPARLIAWYQLAELEAESGISVGALDGLNARRNGEGYLAHEMGLSFVLTARSIVIHDVGLFLRQVPLELAAVQVLGSSFQSRLKDSDAVKPVIGMLDPVSPTMWQDERYFPTLGNMIVAFALQALNDTRPADIDILCTEILAAEKNERISNFIDLILKPGTEALIPDLTTKAASIVGVLKANPDGLDPNTAFYSTCYLWNWMCGSLHAIRIQDGIANLLSRYWADVLARRRFLLKNARLAAEEIEAALAYTGTSKDKIAKLCLAADLGVPGVLGEEFRKMISESLPSSN